MRIRVYYEDTDAGGVVYYANYLRFLERARTEYFRAEDVDLAAWHERGVLFAVARVEVDYRRPARYNDLLEVDTRIVRLGRSSMVLEQEVRLAGGGPLCVAARVRLACVDAGIRPTRIPRDVRALAERRLAAETGS